MLNRFLLNTRAARALVAICLAASLAVALFVHERALTAARERAIFSVSAMSWKVSELIFEIQRLAAGLDGYSQAQLSREDVNLRFDLLWSRVSVLNASDLVKDYRFASQLDKIAVFLAAEEPALYDAAEIAPQDISRAKRRLESLARETRLLWVDLFAARQTTDRTLAVTEPDPSSLRTRILITALILLLMLYVLGEVYFAGRGHARERALREEAAQANEAKSRFLANVSHEIRTPLNGILGMASELAETELTDDQALCLRIIKESGGVLLGTINDVLDLSRIEAGQLPVEFRPFDLRDVLEAARALYTARAREKGIALTLHVDDDLPAVILSDGRRLRQVLHNLIANAVKFTEKGGVAIRAYGLGNRLIIDVQDTGVGVPDDARQRIFQPFGQADNSATRAQGGAGLGLAISRQLCEAMGGGLILRDTQGPGSCFGVDLPLHALEPDALQRGQAAAAAPPDLSGARMLVADDNATNRLLLARFLSRTGASLEFAENGDQALAMARQQRFDIILMDIQMPQMDGVTASQAIRAFQLGAGQAPSVIVAVTANVLKHQVEEYLAAGMDDMLPKPVSKRGLMALLGRYGARRAA